MSFNEIKGHESQIDLLVSSLQNKRIAQSYLFVGKVGIGKSRVAKEFAKLLNCEEDNGIDCCDKCITCSKIGRSLHPDVLCVQSDGTEAIKIEQIRNLKWFFSLAPFEADYKIAIIDGADFLTTEASNSLLKMLEEPNKKAILILIATTQDRLLPTVVSRCQIVRFRGLSVDTLCSILCADYNFSRKDSRIYTNYSNGSLGLALKLKEADLMSLRENIISNSLLKNRINIIEDALFNASNSQDFKRIMFILLTLFRDSFILKTTHAEDLVTNIDYCAEIREFYKYMNAQQSILVLDKIMETYKLIDKNINKRLIIASILSYITLYRNTQLHH